MLSESPEWWNPYEVGFVLVSSLPPSQVSSIFNSYFICIYKLSGEGWFCLTTIQQLITLPSMIHSATRTVSQYSHHWIKKRKLKCWRSKKNITTNDCTWFDYCPSRDQEQMPIIVVQISRGKLFTANNLFLDYFHHLWQKQHCGNTRRKYSEERLPD